MRWIERLTTGIAAAAVLAACSGRAAEERAAETARGAPPAEQDTTATSADRNRSTAPIISRPPSRIVTHEVHTGPHGMAAQVRWTLSPDRRAIIVVEDPVGVEAEPVPDGFLYASEATGAVVQVNGVWDVAPSPDWSHLALGRAFVFRSGEAETIPEREWQRLFAWLPEDVAAPSEVEMRRRAEPYTFPASGMSYARAIALAQVVEVGRLGAGRLAVVEGPTLRLEGWRVRWTPSGDTLAVGSAPRSVQDDAAATRWTLVRPTGSRSYRDSIGIAPAGLRFIEQTWVEGPTIDISIEIDMRRERRVSAGGGAVVSRDSVVTFIAGSDTTRIGAGAALAATRDGRFVAALAPNPSREEFAPKVRVVVYELVP